jgi:Carboxypeptidase regulatory-like domain/TonB-dependent Receptor Plug Domain
MKSRVPGMVMVVLCLAAPVMAQGQQSGTLSGRISSSDSLVLPGAMVTVSSSALQGVRATATDINGLYTFPGLPPGEYVVKFEMHGMSTVERHATVSLGGLVTMDQVLSIAPVNEVVVVHGARPAPVSSPAGAFNIRSEEFARMPVARTPFGLAELAPGLTDNTPNNNQVTMGGAFAYDNVFLMDGVDINDNVLGQPNALFIEDAIQEAQVLTSGVSAEYGRFSGGVINVITKSGSNLFSGALRTNLTNPSWSVETPFEKSAGTTRASKLSPTYELTLGGPIVRDRVWFFGGSRIERTTTQGTFAQTRLPYTSKNDNTRYEGKVTATVANGHTLQTTWIDNTTDLVQPAFGGSIDPAAMTTPSTLNRLFAATWHGALGTRTFATAQYSQKFWKLENAGGTSTNLLESPILTRGVTSGVPANLQYNAPYFDSTDPEQRNNRQFTASVQQMLSSRRGGSHELKGGFEYFVSTRVGGNSQTSTGFVFQTDYKLDAESRPALDANGDLIPRFIPGTSRVQAWLPLRGATIDITTASLFVNDHWVATPRLTLDLGVRYETVGSEATGIDDSIDAQTLVPRAAAAFDLTGDGRTILQGTYGHYAGKYNDVQFSRNSNVGNADRYVAQYTGPAGEGRGFAPGFDPANYTISLSGTFPTANVFFADDLRSPLTKEFSVALAREVGRRGWARATYVNRRATDFVEDFITIDGGRTTINRNGLTGTFDNSVYRNTDLGRREYQAVDLQSSYRLGSSLMVNGQWTVQLENDGNFEGEAASNPAIPSLIGDYPEIYIAERSFPVGRLDDFQRHKVRVWANYSFDLRGYGQLDVAPLYRYNSPRTFSLAAASVPLTAQQIAANPGYVRLPAGQPLFFGLRGSQEFEDFALFDLGVTYGVPVWQSVRPWVKLEVLNLFNNQQLVSWDTSVTADIAGPKDANGLPLNYITGPNFGKATSNANFARPRQGMDGGRTFIVAAGIKF